MRTPFLIVSLSLLTAAVAAGQETQTERSAAASVIERMKALEGSLGLDQLVARLAGPDRRRDAVMTRARQLMDDELLTDYLTAHGFTVEHGVAGLATAFVARYAKGTPGPKLGVIVEYDALGEVGHRAFTIDAQAMAGVLYAYATDARYRATVTREFTGLQGLYADYLAALRTAYPLPTVPDATDR